MPQSRQAGVEDAARRTTVGARDPGRRGTADRCPAENRSRAGARTGMMNRMSQYAIAAFPAVAGAMAAAPAVAAAFDGARS
nr:hypothetical protein KPHV_72800 [Kitasatospora purpeofusca]